MYRILSLARIFPLVVCSLLAGQSRGPQSSPDTPPKMQFVEVEHNVKLEVIDWGGHGHPLVLLPGLGNTAHIFEKMAPKLASNFHVLGITRRGFGDSSAPEPNKANYSAQRLGEDVLAVTRALKLGKPLVAGHSIAGEELSYIGTTHPEEVAGIIYLDAGYPYALYNDSRGDSTIDADELRRKLGELANQLRSADRMKLVDELLATDLPAMEKLWGPVLGGDRLARVKPKFYIVISKWEKRAFIRVDIGEMELHKLYDGLPDAVTEAETLGLIDRHVARAIPKYRMGFRGPHQGIDPATLLQVGFKPLETAA